MSPKSINQKDEIHQLISKGRKEGYLHYEEIEKTFNRFDQSKENFDAFLGSMDDYGIKIIDSKQKEITPKKRRSNLVSLQGLERTTDPVKLYLRFSLEKERLPLRERSKEVKNPSSKPSPRLGSC